MFAININSDSDAYIGWVLGFFAGLMLYLLISPIMKIESLEIKEYIDRRCIGDTCTTERNNAWQTYMNALYGLYIACFFLALLCVITYILGYKNIYSVLCLLLLCVVLASMITLIIGVKQSMYMGKEYDFTFSSITAIIWFCIIILFVISSNDIIHNLVKKLINRRT